VTDHEELGHATRLLQLQELDTELLRLQKRLDDMPEMHAIVATRKKRAEVEGLLGKAQMLTSRIERDIARIDDECAGLNSKIDTEQAKVMSGTVTNPKELVSITREMDALKRRRDKLELEEVQLMEKAETASGQMGKIRLALDTLSAREEKETAAFVEVGSKIQLEIANQQKKRADVAAILSEALLERYEATKNVKEGVAVGQLEKNACTACRMQLPAEKVQELRKGPIIAACPACRRILIVDLGGDGLA